MALAEKPTPSTSIAPHAPAKGLAGMIFRKEWREILRDRRTMFAAFISPLLITPLLIWGSSQLVSGQQKSEANTVYAVGLVDSGANTQLAQAVRRTPKTSWTIISRESADSLIAKHKLRAAVVIPADSDAALTANRTVHVTVLEDEGNDVSQSAGDRIDATLKMVSDRLRTMRLQKAGLTQEFGTPIVSEETPIKGGGSVAMFMLALFLPYVVTITAFSGGMYAASDQVAGEKERGTLETLLVSPASRRDIATGKFMAVGFVCLASGILSIVGLVVPFALHMIQMVPGQTMAGFSVTPKAVVTMLLAQIPLALLFAGILIALSTYARTQKEVQAYQSPLIILVLMPAMVSMFAPSDTPLWMALVPILNSTMVIKQTLSGVTNLPFIATAFVASAVYAGLAILLSVRLFENEKVLLKS